MFKKITYLLAVIVCLALVIPSFSCAAGPSSINKGLELKLDKAPRLNEPVKLNCVRKTSDFAPPGQEKKASDNVSQGKSNLVPPKHEKITLEFERIDPKTYFVIKVPAQEVLAGGNLNWEGDMTGEPMDFSVTLKFPYEGNWGIYARSSQRPEDKDGILFNVAEGSGSFGWPKDYRPITGPFPNRPTEQSPITVELDIPKPPRLNEPVQLIWSLNSIRDIDEVIGKVEFWHLEGTTGAKVPVEDMLIAGDLTWNGSLKKDSPLHFSATIKFPQEGDWAIQTYGDSYVEQQPINAGSSLFLHIDKDKSRWGWTEPHKEKYEGPPPEPIIPVPHGNE